MAKRYSKLNLRALLFLLVAIVMVVGFVACKRTQEPSNYSYEVDAPTGVIDSEGNVVEINKYITNYVFVTNKEYIFDTNDTYQPNKIIYVTNYQTNFSKGEVITNYIYVDKVQIKTNYVTNVVPDVENTVSKWHSSFMYKVYAPFAGVGAEGDWKYTNLSYLDTKALSKWWEAVIHRHAFAGGNEFYIPNPYGAGGYFYFDNSMNIRWNKRPQDILKKFVQGLIVQYRGGSAEGTYAIAGLYQLNKSSAEVSAWGNDGANLMQGYYVSKNRNVGEYDIIVMNTGHVYNGGYGFQIYNSSYNYAYGTNPYFEQRPEYYMSKITLVLDLWKNYRPYPIEQQNLQFQYGWISRPN